MSHKVGQQRGEAAPAVADAVFRRLFQLCIRVREARGLEYGVPAWRDWRGGCEVSSALVAAGSAFPREARPPSAPKSSGPRAGTIVPSVRPVNSIGSAPAPGEKAKMHCAYADLSGYAASKLLRPAWPVLSRNHFMYTPGKPPSALKHKEVSSTSTGPRSCSAARRHFSRATYSGSPCSSGRSSFTESSGKGKRSPRICITSSNFFLLPVTNLMVVGSMVGRKLVGAGSPRSLASVAGAWAAAGGGGGSAAAPLLFGPAAVT
jgi:hypothetical protein